MSFALAYLLWSVVWLVPPALGLYPILKIGTRKGWPVGRAENNSFRVYMPDPEKIYVGHWNHVLVQEIGEYYAWWIADLLAALIPSYLFWTYATDGDIRLGLAFIAVLTIVIRPFWKLGIKIVNRQFEYIGWAAEIADGKAAGNAYYEDDAINAARIKAGYLFFDKLTKDQVARGLKRWTPVGKLIRLIVTLWLKRYQLRA